MINTSPDPIQFADQPIVDAYDVIVMGAGPAGSTVAALVAEVGHRVLLLERSTIPRFHVGESLIPETYWPLKRLGLIDKLKQSSFPKKYSVQFVTEAGKETAPFYFDKYKDHESSQTWQVERSEFDVLLLENAIDKGVTFKAEAHVLDVDFESDDNGQQQATGVHVKLRGQADSESRHIKAKVVVDATGQSAVIAQRLNLKVPDPHLQKGAIWSYFQGALRDPGKDEGATIILQTEGKKSWFWYIPLSSDIVSVGCTGNMDYLFGEGETNSADIFARELERCPGMQRRLKDATQAAKFFTTRDFSYRTTQSAGPGWLLVGDAFGFIDPVYSSGVLLALKSGEWAADAICEGLNKNDLSSAQLGCWQSEYSSGVENFRKLVYAFYAPEFSFAKFLRRHPNLHSHLVDVLIGDVFKPELAELFEAMGNIVPASA